MIWFSRSGWRAGLPLALLPAAVMVQGPLVARGTEPVLRVLLEQAGSLELGAPSSPLRLEDGRGQLLVLVPAGATLRLSTGGGGLQARVAGGGGAGRSLNLPLRQVWVDPQPAGGNDALFSLGRRRFRGRLQVRPEGQGLQAINHIKVESYLPSVVGGEMPASWPQAALRAQAVAARTYALRQRKPSAPFDLKATVASQVYKGIEAETPSTRQAVASTRSQVLMHGNGLINAVFHSSSGGSTENSGEIWTTQLPYLVSVPDFDDSSPVRDWKKQFTPWQLRKAFPETGGVRRIDVLTTTATGRIRQARVVGPRGSLVLKGSELRSRLQLRSTLAQFVFDGAGDTLSRAVQNRPRPIPLTVVNSTGTTVSGASTSGPTRGESSSSRGNGANTSLRSSLSALLDAVASSSSTIPANRYGSARSTSPRNMGPAARPSREGADPSLLVIGRGFGHGVGMSQWGAYGLALRGERYEDILRHFYRGAQLRPYRPL
jgi:stage II sporulation protein D